MSRRLKMLKVELSSTFRNFARLASGQVVSQKIGLSIAVKVRRATV
jgi:hypothetical protein